MKLTFEYLGTERTLNKHPKIQLALKRGQITEADATAAPWYLRAKLDGKERAFKLPSQAKDAIRAAKDILKGHHDQPSAFADFLAARQNAAGITLGELAKQWQQAGYPTDDGHPRAAGASARLAQFLGYALKYWATKRATTVTRANLLDYATWRRAHTARGTGDRATDLELNSLSCMCAWAVATERLAANPFASRPRFRRADDVTHCHQRMPGSDEELHQILAWLFSSDQPSHQVAGGWLACCALTGLRPGEPATLQRHAELAQPPANPRDLAPGTVFKARDGRRMMKVQRLKNGQNPYVHLHPAASDFLDTWRQWLEADPELKASPYWFPQPGHPDRPLIWDSHTGPLNDALRDAAAGTGLPAYKPHGFGRAYYVRVRRSQGADDTAIASELGQTSNGELIRSTYGDPADMAGGAQFDWLPDAKPDAKALPAPAWAQLVATGEQPANIIMIG
jgi:hypothetical protein